MDVLRRLRRTEGLRWIWRGVDKNLVSVAVPVGLTIFLTDVLVNLKEDYLL